MITRHAARNYGSLLQTLATGELLRRWSGDVRFVDYRQPGHEDTGWAYANRGSVGKYGWWAKAFYASVRAPGARKAARLFDGCLREHERFTADVYRSESALEQSEEFLADSWFCAGSDQVWNITTNCDNRPYYLDFAPDGARKFSLASSIGGSSLPGDEGENLVRALRSFVGVSVREDRAVDYLGDFGIEAHRVVDPVLAVDRGFWDDFSRPSGVQGPYLLVYELNRQPEFKRTAMRLSQLLGIPIVRVEYWRRPESLLARASVLPEPAEFVGLFRDAAFVLTDSFHGLMFSTIFRRPFIVLAPPRYCTRIDSFLRLTDQEYRSIASSDEAAEVAATSCYGHGLDDVLRRERVQMDAYIESVIRS